MVRRAQPSDLLGGAAATLPVVEQAPYYLLLSTCSTCHLLLTTHCLLPTTYTVGPTLNYDLRSSTHLLTARAGAGSGAARRRDGGPRPAQPAPGQPARRVRRPADEAAFAGCGEAAFSLAKLDRQARATAAATNLLTGWFLTPSASAACCSGSRAGGLAVLGAGWVERCSTPRQPSRP